MKAPHKSDPPPPDDLKELLQLAKEARSYSLMTYELLAQNGVVFDIISRMRQTLDQLLTFVSNSSELTGSPQDLHVIRAQLDEIKALLSGHRPPMLLVRSQAKPDTEHRDG